MRTRSFTSLSRFVKNRRYAIQNGSYISYEIVGNLYILKVYIH